MIKSNLKEIVDLIANIDYCFEQTFPVRFKVDGKTYEAGLCYFDWGHIDDVHGKHAKKIKKQIMKFCGICETPFFECQYLAEINDCGGLEVLDLQDPDAMVYSEIAAMIGKLCGADRTSIITLDKRKSFKGGYEICSSYNISDSLFIKIEN